MISLKRLVGPLKADLGRLATSRPGRRFIEHYNRRQETRRTADKPWKTAAVYGAAAVLLLAGLVLSIPPGFPGFLLWLPALGILVARLKFLALILDRAELVVRRLFGQTVG